MAVKRIQVTQEHSLIEDLFQAYYDARRNKRNSLSALAFELEYEKNLLQLYDEIKNRSYKPSPYSAFIVEKPVKREVFASDFRDRVVHHLIFNYLNPIFDPTFINDSYSCRMGKGTSYGIQRVNYFIRSCSDNYTKDAYILKLDIKGYFMSIDRTILFGIIERRITKKQHRLSCELDLIVFLVKGVIFCDPTKGCVLKSTRESWLGLPKSKSLFYSGANKGLPIGNLTSQLFANIYLDGLDQFIKRQLQFRYYGRYVDDMVIVHGDKQRLLVAVKEISDYLSEHVSLTLHPKKIYLQHAEKGVSFLGVYIKPYRVMIGKRVRRNVLNEINLGVQTLKQIAEKNNTQSINEFYFDFCQRINSYFGLLRQVDSYNFRRDLKKMITYGFSGRLQVDKDQHKLVVVHTLNPDTVKNKSRLKQ